ncbi:MAG TPA: DUF4331 domain-containing protein [Verrucomicrobiae bacterium]|nr:DUF4331 domain-containing protein [Verrucomicrobiae bacterium]
MKKVNPYLAVALAWLMAAPVPMLFAASHREAPLTALDHAADITDFFAFVSYDDPTKVTFILCVDPFLEPANGPNYFPFDPNVLYSIKIDNNYDAVEDITFNFQFTTQILAPGLFTGFVGAGGGIGGVIPPAITSLTGSGASGLSLKQTYTVNMVQGAGSSATTTNLTSSVTPIAVPSNVGPRTMPNYPALAKQGIFNLGNGITVFAGTVADPFYIDLGAAFDSLNFRPGAYPSGVVPVLSPQDDANNSYNTAADTLSGYNVNCIAIQVPISMVTANGKATIGTWGATYRPAMTVRSNGPETASGGYVQVQRMGNPLINELIIGTGDKDNWSRAVPSQDSQFAHYALNPLLATVFQTVYGVNVPPAPRNDLLFLVQYLPVITGDSSIPPGPVADLLRLNTKVAPTSAAARSRLGVLGGDVAGFPNGRRVSDDVTDISMRAVAGALVGNPIRLGDGVNSKDVGYQETFPYVQWANSGYSRRHINPGDPACFNLSTAPCAK